MRQVVASLVSPVPTFDIIAVAADDGSANGFYAVAVERTVAAPHAVLVGNALRYPRRNGTTTRYLSEPEVAEAYRARLAGLGEQAGRLREVWQNGVDQLNTEEGVWVALAMVPGVRGDRRVDQAEFQRFTRQAHGEIPTVVRIGFSTRRTQVGRGYFCADGTNDGGERRSSFFRMELHSDGSGFFAVDVGWRRPPQDDADEALPPSVIDDEALTISVISGLLRIGQHTRDEAAASGDAVVRVGFWQIGPATPTLLGHPRGGTWNNTYNSRPLVQNPDPLESTAALDSLAEPGPALLSTAGRICDSLAQSFGVAELGQITSDGALRLPYWSHQIRPGLTAWVEVNALELVDEQLP